MNRPAWRSGKAKYRLGSIMQCLRWAEGRRGEWSETSEWLRNATVVAELEGSQEDQTIIRRGQILRVMHYHGDIAITIFPEDQMQF